MSRQASCTSGVLDGLKGCVHPVYMAKRKFSPTYIRQWRDKRELTLEALAEAIQEAYPGLKGATHASLGRIERGLQPYSQALIEAIAEVLQTTVGALIEVDPDDPGADIWPLWRGANLKERRRIVNIAKAVTGEDA